MRRYVLDGRTVQAHKGVPLLFVSDRCALFRDDPVFDQLLETGQGMVRWVHALCKREVALGVLVAVVDDRLVRKRAKIRERGMHLTTDALKEAAAARDKKGVAREHATGVVVSLSGCIVANRILGVAWRC